MSVLISMFVLVFSTISIFNYLFGCSLEKSFNIKKWNSLSFVVFLYLELFIFIVSISITILISNRYEL